MAAVGSCKCSDAKVHGRVWVKSWYCTPPVSASQLPQGVAGGSAVAIGAYSRPRFGQQSGRGLPAPAVVRRELPAEMYLKQLTEFGRFGSFALSWRQPAEREFSSVERRQLQTEPSRAGLPYHNPIEVNVPCRARLLILDAYVKR